MKDRVIKAVSDELQGSARELTRKSGGAVEYWNAIATSAVNRTLQILKDTPNELSNISYTIEAASRNTRPKLIGNWINDELRPDGSTKLESRPPRRQRSHPRKAPAAKRAPPRRKRSRKNP